MAFLHRCLLPQEMISYVFYSNFELPEKFAARICICVAYRCVLLLPFSFPKPQSDDFDLNEVFAEYFINEFDDPMNAYTSSMANYGGGVNAMAMTQVGSLAMDRKPAPGPGGTVNLPTGGIKTVFHAGTAPQVKNNGEPGAAAAVQPPPAKKVKQDANLAPMASSLAAPNTLASAAQIPFAHPGFHMMMAQQQQQQALVAQQQVQQSMQHVQQLQQSMQQAQAGMQQPQAGAGGGRVALPVGVGIRLGGVGGIAPAMAQSAPGMVQSQFTMWGPPGGGAVPDHQVAERRQRNREHAKRSRVRKKFLLEALQEEVRGLQRENQGLRMIVQEHVPEHALQIIAECCTTNPLFADDIETATGKKKQDLVKSDFSLIESLSTGQQCFVLSDPKLPDNPIVFATPGFYKLTGYTSKEVLGRNCRFLQGPGTDTRAVDIIRKAVATGSDATVCLLNYKADGSPFWNQFFIGALRDSDNCIVNYVSRWAGANPHACVLYSCFLYVFTNTFLRFLSLFLFVNTGRRAVRGRTGVQLGRLGRACQ
jgi:PAS domain-containing protein